MNKILMNTSKGNNSMRVESDEESISFDIIKYLGRNAHGVLAGNVK